MRSGETATISHQETALPAGLSGGLTKRDGRVVSWDRERIISAAARAMAQVRSQLERGEAPDYGLDAATYQKAGNIADAVAARLAPSMKEGAKPGVELIQDLVEKELVAAGEFEAARAYILYRAGRARARTTPHGKNGLQDYIAIAKYSRYRPELGRREVWPEPAERARDMHLRRFAWVDGQLPLPIGSGTSFSEEIKEVFQSVCARRVLPSMRSLQFGGAPIEKEEARMFNCAFTFINRLDSFKEVFWLLLCGTGTGFSVQRRHIQQLPEFPSRPLEDELPVLHHEVEDTIKGWSDSLDVLLRSYFSGHLVEFSYSAIRPKGEALRTSGGRAPGHVPLRRALDQIRALLNRVPGRQMTPLEAYDIVMFAAKAVLSGGIRRSATICLFSADDHEMMCAKTGNWFEVNPQRSASNNSAVINRHKTPKNVFLSLFEKQKEFGEPGFYFVENEDYGANPCVEIGLAPFVKLSAQGEIDRLRELGYEGELHIGQTLSGWQMCNLCTINGAACATAEDFYQACRHAAFIGTLQASYTKMPYLGPVTQFINERESLLGVSITGILDNPDLLLDPSVLEHGAQEVKSENARVANIIGIPRSARTTCVKPEGTASLLLGTSSGIHPHHSKRYFRRVQANRQEPVYQHFRESNPHMTERGLYNPNDDVIAFPVQARAGAITRDELDAVKFLNYVKLVQQHWVIPGRAYDHYNPGLHHNVSNTCVVRPEEWNAVADFLWSNRQYFTGIALLSFSGDKIYPQAPNEAVVSEADIVRWGSLAYNPVDYSALRESVDNTNLKEVVACAGGACDLVLA